MRCRRANDGAHADGRDQGLGQDFRQRDKVGDADGFGNDRRQRRRLDRLGAAGSTAQDEGQGGHREQ